jgi:DNA-directed RNA polymerase subunit RPC12/RpoP
MVQLEELHYCNNCDAEFSVYSSFETDDLISFCPYCGSEIEDIDEEIDDFDMDDDESEEDDYNE